eukprot:TRINITY_DN49613_c0_g1_i1.p1 TRINITY_DN49613_c0_g1~~TRINITY_DN49613_c0_g1_i1.p1  ORF type:complete len:499 (-),score=52.81 TRINITY_DN49613_c0_g1_i1:522-2018(-)
MDHPFTQAVRGRARSASRSQTGVLRSFRPRALSSPGPRGACGRPDRCACADEEGACQGLTGGFHDALAFSRPAAPRERHQRVVMTSRGNHVWVLGPEQWQSTRRVAIVGGGPAGITAALALIQEACAAQDGVKGLPEMAVTIFEKRSDPCRRQHVYLDFGRLGQTPAAGELRFDRGRLESLLHTHGVVPGPGTSLELRVLERCLMQLLVEKASSARGRVAVRWVSRAFLTKDLRHFDDVVGADGRRSEVRQLLMERLPVVPLKQQALEVQFKYNCHLEWQEADKLHILNLHKYGAWRPVILFHRLLRREMPEYIEIARHDYEVMQRCFRTLIAEGRSPFTSPFATLADFLQILDSDPETQRSVRDTLLRHLEVEFSDFDPCAPALVAPVDLTLHRAPHLVTPAQAPKSRAEPNLWLLGDSAVGLPISMGCNLVYHMASAGKLASTLVHAANPQTYEDFVFNGWHGEAWKSGRAFRAPLPSQNADYRFRATRIEGRFIK